MRAIFTATPAFFPSHGVDFSAFQFRGAHDVQGASHTFSAPSFGVQAGYNHKLNEQVMIGIEADLQRNNGFHDGAIYCS